MQEHNVEITETIIILRFYMDQLTIRLDQR